MTNFCRTVAFLLLLAITTLACDDTPAAQAPIERPTQTSSTIDIERSWDTEKLAELVDFIEQARRENEIPGAAAALVHSDTILWAEGFGVRDVRSNARVTPETLFHIGSTHKSITAMLIATLVDDGLLDWDTPVVTIYPDFELSEPDATQDVTVRYLLSMSSGIPAEAEDAFDVETDSAEELFTLLAEIALFSYPGEYFSYSNISAAVAGYVAVLAAGGEMGQLYDGYVRLLQERILDPIGMHTATLSVEEARTNLDYAESHIMEGRGNVVVSETYDFTGDPLAPSGSLKASVLDMARYLSTQVSRGVAPDGTRVVSGQNLVETWHPQIEDDESGGEYGMGWVIQAQDGVSVIWHEGSYDDYNAMLLFVPEAATGLVLLTNLDDPGDFLEVVSEEFVRSLTEPSD